MNNKQKEKRLARIESKLGQVASHSGPKNWRAKDFRVASNTSFAGVVNRFTNIGQGTTSQDRQGEKIRLQKLWFNVQSVLSATDATNVVTYLFFISKMSQAPSLVPSNILEANSTVDAPTSPIAYDHLQHIRVIKRVEHVLDTYNPHQVTEMELSLGNSLCSFFGTAGTDEDVGALYCLLITDSGAVSHPSSQISCRVFFTTD